jgi:hypothetical protein
MTCSTKIRLLENSLFRAFSSWVNSLLCGFFCGVLIFFPPWYALSPSNLWLLSNFSCCSRNKFISRFWAFFSYLYIDNIFAYLYVSCYVLSLLEDVDDAFRLVSTTLGTGHWLFPVFAFCDLGFLEYNEVHFSFW